MAEVWGPSRGHGIPMGCWLHCWWSGRTSPTPPALLRHWRGFPRRSPSRIKPAVRMLHPRLAVVSDVSVGDVFSQAGSLSLGGEGCWHGVHFGLRPLLPCQAAGCIAWFYGKVTRGTLSKHLGRAQCRDWDQDPGLSNREGGTLWPVPPWDVHPPMLPMLQRAGLACWARAPGAAAAASQCRAAGAR